MENIKIKHREFVVEEEVSENIFIATYKNKQYTVIKFEPHSRDSDLLIYSLKRINSSPIRSPKLFWIDKKAGYAVREYIKNENMMNVLAREDLSEEMYDQLFKNAYYARVAVMTIDYQPNAWGISDGTLYYLGTSFVPFRKEIDLADKYLRLWFNTRELSEFLKNNGVFYDKSRLKDEYSVNKQIVLMVCKYYR